MRYLLAIGFVLALSAPSGEVALSPESLAKLKGELGAVLPRNWEVKSVGTGPERVEVVRKEQVTAVMTKAFPSPDADRPEPMKKHDFECSFRVVAFLTPEEYRTRTKANAERAEQIAVFRKALADVPMTKPSGREDKWYRPRTDEQRKRVAELTKYLDENPGYELPTHKWGESAFVIFDLFEFYDDIEFASDAERNECRGIRAKIEKVLIPYRSEK